MSNDTVEPRIPGPLSSNVNETRLQAIVDERIGVFQGQITQALTSLTDEFRAMRAEVAQMHININALGIKVSSLNKNAASQQYNITVTRENMPLAPLYSVETGQVILNFPDTTYAISQLRGDELDNILRQLDMIPVGNIEFRRRQLLLAYGVVARSV